MRPHHLISRRDEVAQRYSRYERDRHPDQLERGEIIADLDAEADRRQWTQAEAYAAIGAAPWSLHDGSLPTADLRGALERLKACP